jgi:hypothetical protein
MEQYYEKNENVLLQKAAEFGMRGDGILKL